jgi:hypothetical protein
VGCELCPFTVVHNTNWPSQSVDFRFGECFASANHGSNRPPSFRRRFVP